MAKDAFENIRQPQHDAFFKSTFSEPEMFRKLLVWLLPYVVELLDLDRMECEKDFFVGKHLKAYYTDLLYRIPISGTDQNIVVFVLVEHKTSPERWTMFQILRYIVLIWQREYNVAKEQGRLANKNRVRAFATLMLLLEQFSRLAGEAILNLLKTFAIISP